MKNIRQFLIPLFIFAGGGLFVNLSSARAVEAAGGISLPSDYVVTGGGLKGNNTYVWDNDTSCKNSSADSIGAESGVNDRATGGGYGCNLTVNFIRPIDICSKYTEINENTDEPTDENTGEPTEKFIRYVSVSGPVTAQNGYIVRGICKYSRYVCPPGYYGPRLCVQKIKENDVDKYYIKYGGKFKIVNGNDCSSNAAKYVEDLDGQCKPCDKDFTMAKDGVVVDKLTSDAGDNIYRSSCFIPNGATFTNISDGAWKTFKYNGAPIHYCEMWQKANGQQSTNECGD